MFIEDGKGKGTLSEVSVDNRQHTSARSNQRIYYVSRDKGQAFVVHFAGEQATGGTTQGLGEFLVQPYAELTNTISTGSSVYYSASFTYPKPLRLYGADQDKLKIIIQDDLSNLTELKVTAIGWEEAESK